MLNFLRLRRADRESQHERTDLDETSELVLKIILLLRRRRKEYLVQAKKFREISPDSRKNMREIDERNLPSLQRKHRKRGAKSGAAPQSGAHK